MEVVEMLLMVEQNQMLHRVRHIREGQAVHQLQSGKFIAKRPEEESGQDSWYTAGIELSQGQILLRPQEQGPAGHQEQRHACVGKAGPKQGRVPGHGSHRAAGKRTGRRVAQHYTPDGGGFHRIYGFIS